jgi:signal transduction histidine kinase
MHSDRAVIMLSSSKEQEAQYVYKMYTESKGNEPVISYENFQTVLKNGKNMIVEDIKFLNEAKWANLEKQNVHSLICVPLISCKRIFGGLYLDRIKNKAPFTHDDVELLAAIAIQIGGSLEKSFLLEKLSKTNKELSLANKRLKKALEELKQAQHQLVQQERLRALGLMASGIAHDFNNNLGAITGFSELLLQRPENMQDPAKVKNYLEYINTAAKDASDVVERLREFYRHRDETEKIYPCDLNEIAKKAISLTTPRWKNEAESTGIYIKIKTELQNIPYIQGNEQSLRQAIINLILNAVDAMPKGGIIKIRTFVENRVVLELSDTGIGMSEDVRRLCLEPFFTTKDIKGTGLGLSSVYGIVKRHNGEINIQSKQGKGTTFSISFPKAEDFIHKNNNEKL